MQTKIIYEDKDIIVVYKPAGIAVQSARIGQPDVESELKGHLAAKERQAGASPYLGIVHRLDQPVEGLLVFGKNRKAAADLSRQVQGAGFHKEYRAVVCGTPDAQCRELVDYLKKEEGRAVVSKEEGKKAILHLEVMHTKKVGGESISLLSVRIETGRFHQIRAQLSHAGFPILGDKKYGSKKSLSLSDDMGIRSIALSACRLLFQHPVTKKMLEYTSIPVNPVFSIFSE